MDVLHHKIMDVRRRESLDYEIKGASTGPQYVSEKEKRIQAHCRRVQAWLAKHPHEAYEHGEVHVYRYGVKLREYLYKIMREGGRLRDAAKKLHVSYSWCQQKWSEEKKRLAEGT